jgi:hypothetical protein
MPPYALLAILAALQAADVYSTRRILLAGGREMNPAVRWLIGRFGLMPALIGAKVAVMAIAWFILLPYPWLLGGLCAFYAGITAYNWKSL